MIFRVQNNPNSHRDSFERTALKITGAAFYFLVVGLLVSGVYTIWIGHRRQTTFWGVIISSLSILTMWILVNYKRKVGNALKSAPLLADANCTLVCIYMSIVLLLSSSLYELFGWLYIDSIGALFLAYFSFKEGKSCFYKAENNINCECD